MTKEKRPVQVEDWETDLGLANDVDAYIKGPYFGFKEEYQKVAGDVPMLILPLVSPEGEDIAAPGFSVGKDWKIAENGKKLVHPTRTRFVKSSSVGKLIDRVVLDLKVPMQQYGPPTDATVWDGLGFHWIQEEHSTLDGQKRTNLMPVSFLGEAGENGPITATKSASVPEGVKDKLKTLAESADSHKQFAKMALKIPEVAANDELMAGVLDDSEAGLYTQLKD